MLSVITIQHHIRSITSSVLVFTCVLFSGYSLFRNLLNDSVIKICFTDFIFTLNFFSWPFSLVVHQKLDFLISLASNLITTIRTYIMPIHIVNVFFLLKKTAVFLPLSPFKLGLINFWIIGIVLRKKKRCSNFLIFQDLNSYYTLMIF